MRSLARYLRALPLRAIIEIFGRAGVVRLDDRIGICRVPPFNTALPSGRTHRSPIVRRRRLGMKKIDIAAIKAARRGCFTTRTSTDRPAFAADLPMGGQDATCNTQEN